MVSVDVSLQRELLLGDELLVGQLPPELLQIIRHHNPTNFLDAVAAAALIPQISRRIFVYFEDVFADVSARWLLKPRNEGQEDRIIASFARILPFAPSLAIFLDRYIRETSLASPDQPQPFQINSLSAPEETDSSVEVLIPSLLAFWRLLYFDKSAYSSLVQPSRIQSLFKHPVVAVRYLAIRTFCIQLSASDVKLEALLETHVGQEALLLADYDGENCDYTFLTLLEQQRARETEKLRQDSAEAIRNPNDQFPPQTLTHLAVRYGKSVLPRPEGPPSSSSSLVPTTTTIANLESLSKCLQHSGPILLSGLPGCGKTSCVYDVARELGRDESMVTLHLNEQTDAKMLIGLYSTDSKPGSFSWRPGVLTTAVREGRWVLIEDLDRAPNEVMSTLLPLIERGELLIPSRGETVKASSSFRLFATVRTQRGLNGQESLPNILGQRFWQQLPVKMPSQSELREIVLGTYPMLHKYAVNIMAVYERLCNGQGRASAGLPGRGANERQITPRDLLKWCRRLNELLMTSGSKTGDEPINETVRSRMFLEAVDCFCGNLQNRSTRDVLARSIAQEWHIPEELREHFVESYVPELEETPNNFRIGRMALGRKKHANRVTKSKRPFASTKHARRLLEQISVAVKLKEPVLLVGETGIGKTTVIQQLADTLGHKLVAVNLSQQSEVGDLLGGFKPVNVRTLAVPLKEEFEDLFAATGISATKNQKYLEQIGKTIAKGQWTRVSKLWHEAPKMFNKILTDLKGQAEVQNGNQAEDGPVAKRRRTESKLQSLVDLQPRWEAFTRNLEQFDVQISSGSGTFAFAFVEGNIVKAVRNGDWVLLDEINLASPDTLESIADLLSSGPNSPPSILLSETGEIERITAHPDFRIFGAMNPATDVGKRDLPLGIRSRFTELYVNSPDGHVDDLLPIIKAYLKTNSNKDEQAAYDVASLYLETKKRAEEKRLVDGANEVPHFSLRTLTRVLSYVNDIAPFYGLRRALFEGFSMGFLTLLDRESENLLVPLIHHYLIDRHGSSKSLLSQPPKHPSDGKMYVRFMNKNKDRQYWLKQGLETLEAREDYIITPYVERNLLNLVRATSTRRFPILIQGPTSAGKTSMIEYLANFSGNKFVRINNHEHTDLQEYLGTYVSGADGKLRFQEGLLVQALRQGHWIVLDELNLAPTDVLEALNRLLDDNRELLIPETQEIVRPHENFMLFATQNPPGLYGGRKVLSRAFRNRFLELHFEDIPEQELETILQKRAKFTAPSDCRRIVNVYKGLSRLRQTDRLFEDKGSFATLRDLFRWALRKAETREEIAVNGFMLLAERVRNEEERVAVKQVIEAEFKVNIDERQLYDTQHSPYLRRVSKLENAHGVVWTHAMRRLYVLVASAIANNEPVLLVGDTGCGKTTVCQLLGDALGKELHIVNAHQNTETGDLIGSQRPVRNRATVLETLAKDLIDVFSLLGRDSNDDLDAMLQEYHSLEPSVLTQVPPEAQLRISSNEIKGKALFEWADGSLVHAMRAGQFFLLDEISLADDSVLERLNSVLEPQRTILLAEKGIDDSFVKANDGFQFFATMNPGGDFGKKELSPALRNRFTEIWVPSLSEHADVLQIVSSKLLSSLQRHSKVIVDFAYWFGQNFRSTNSAAFSIRDILVWVKFVNNSRDRDGHFAVVHGAATVFIDTLGANPSALIALDPRNLDQQRQKCLEHLTQLLGQDALTMYNKLPELVVEPDVLRIGPFSIPRAANENFEKGFALHAPTTRVNAMRVIRAMQVQKPILLEGSPGVGKTTLVSALAKACGQNLTRINLSDQTDLMDLFGTDVPIEGAEAGHFAWRDAPFLRAMKNGEWVLLDEMNLASQSVLEGLNACLDHREEVYISELDQVFKRHPDFRLFAAQNPHHQGGGRKGLPSSFVNRFIVVYADVFKNDDLLMISQHTFPNASPETVKKMINFVSQLDEQVVYQRAFGSQGAPWEFNLRDTLRWLQLLTSSDPLMATAKADDFLNVVVKQRFRSRNDRDAVDQLFEQAFQGPPKGHQLYHSLASGSLQVGLALMRRNQLAQPVAFPGIDAVPRLSEIESILICIKENLPCLLVGPSGSGKSALLQHIAALVGKSLVVFPMNADIDTMDLVGGFEQTDPLREVNAALQNLVEVLETNVLKSLPSAVPEPAIDLLNLLQQEGDKSQDRHRLLSCIVEVRALLPDDSVLAVALDKSQIILQKPIGIKDPRFEWLDGIIVKALQNGDWLVLDNANLCSASVLDRLNSLLEPNGFLIINEHCGPDGEPRIVKPHPDFRIFLTMDPRYGELSRAMRNRGIEIHVDILDPLPQQPFPKGTAQVEPKLQRWDIVSSAISQDTAGTVNIGHLAVDCLSMNDLTLLDKYQELMKYGVARPTSLSSEETTSSSSNPLQIVSSFIQSPAAENFGSAVRKLYQSIPESDFPGLLTVQPLHPLQNSTMLPLLGNTSQRLPMWLGTILELYHELIQASKSMEEARSVAVSRQVSALNRLQRSMMSDSVAAVAKDATVGASKFLTLTLQAIESFLRSQLSNEDSWKERRAFLRTFLHFWRRTFRLLSESPFDEARFQAHLGQITSFMTKKLSQPEGGDEAAQELVSFIEGGLRASFATAFKLSTGLSMERLWPVLRPIPITSAEQLQRVRQMEQLASRVDELKWKIHAPVDDITKIVNSLTKVYELVRVDEVNCDELLAGLQKQVEELEGRFLTDNYGVAPFFSDQFEVLRRIVVLDSTSQSDTSPENMVRLSVLSNLPILPTMRLSGASSSSKTLQLIDYFLGNEEASNLWTKTFSSAVVKQVDSISSASLSSLQILDVELPSLTNSISLFSRAITEDPLSKLRGMLMRLFGSVSATMGLTEALSALQHCGSSVIMGETGLVCDEKTLPDSITKFSPKSVRDILVSHFAPALLALHESAGEQKLKAAYLGAAWAHFSIGMIKLFVPDKIFDPQVRPLLELESYDELHTNLDNQLLSLKAFEKFFTGQSSNIRCELIGDEINDLGERPTGVQIVYRPSKSEVSELQGDFKNLLKAVLGLDLVQALVQHCHGQPSATQQVEVVRESVARMIFRLNSRLSAYEDMARPVVNLLRCLQISLSVADVAASTISDEDNNSLSLLQYTPFFGGKLSNLVNCSETITGFEYLGYIRAIVSVQGLKTLSLAARQRLHHAVHTFYTQWSQKLEADRKEEQSKRSMYRYRGGLDEEEAADQEEFDELFPTFQNEEEEEVSEDRDQKPIQDSRALAIKLATIHEDIYVTPQHPSDSIKDLGRFTARKIAAEESRLAATDRALLTGTLWIASEKLAEFEAGSAPANYNFYTEPNLQEARKLVKLVGDIRVRFRQLQHVDEIGHMQPLKDVVSASDKVLELGHAEPLAKAINKVEQLHAFVYEWQFGGWASHVHGALSLYNKLTEMLVSWRRLELSTWGKLFDMERTKCDEDAKSWWFIAYQAVIAGPMSLAQNGESLQEHAKGLLQELESYFSTSIVGQFSARLGLLRQLAKQLDLLVVDYPELVVIQKAVMNFVIFYSRFEKTVEETIRNGRAPIEKKMKDVLLMASWKDTNIAALRESARKSHQKLFRLVRKFRAVLGQPMKTVIEQGLPDEQHATVAEPKPDDNIPRINTDAVDTCRQNIEGWSTDLKRLANVQKTVALMSKMSRSSVSNMSPSQAIDLFLSNISESMAELRKETPAFLTEENTNLVKHLKSRKRKLFAEVLKDARHMGINYNPGANILAKQNSLSAVLASVNPLTSGNHQIYDAIEYYFQKALDLAPGVRTTAQTHSDDLTGAEVARSIGFLEGLLHAIIGQRTVLAQAAERQAAMVDSLNRIQSIVARQDLCHIQQSTNCSEVSTWLIQIIKIGIQLVEIHSKLGNLDNSAVLQPLSQFLTKFEGSTITLRSSSYKLPDGIASRERLQSEKGVAGLLEEFQQVIDQACEIRPDLAFVLEQIRLWTSLDSRSVNGAGQPASNIDDLVSRVKRLSDSILVAVEQFNKAARALPESTEEASWLVKHGEGMSTVINALHLKDISASIDQTLSAFVSIDLDDASTNILARSLITVVMPIVRQYQSICHSSIGKFAALHFSTCKMAHFLSKSYTQLASQGFCTPQEKSDETSKESGNLESGTGLGDGEGAEDISKDIQPDEDLSELAQEKNKESKEDIEDEKDAVDMADEEMEGDLGSVDGKEDDEKGSKSGDEDDESGDEMDEEAGDVDDLDPNAVDEKMWDGENEDEAEKDQQGDQSKGQKKDDEQIAADQESGKKEDQPEEPEEGAEENQDLGAEQDEDVQFDEMNRQDQDVQEQDTLALPDDMDIDGKDDESMSSISDDNLDELSDTEEAAKDEDDVRSLDKESNAGDEGEEQFAPTNAEGDEDDEEPDEQPKEEDQKIQEDEEMEMNPDEEATEDHDKEEQPSTEDANAGMENAAPSDVKSGGQDQDDTQAEEQNASQDNAAQREDGQMGESASEQDKSAGDKGSVSKAQEQPSQGELDDAQDSSLNQPFKALGDALEKWHRQQREIKEAQNQENQDAKNDKEAESQIKEFQHLQNDESAADTQAIGAANEEEVKPFDDSMAIDEEDNRGVDNQIMPEAQDDAEDEDAAEKMDTSEPLDSKDQDDSQKDEPRTGVSTRQGAYNRDITPPFEGADREEQEEEEESIEETSSQLMSTHIAEPDQPLRDFEESLHEWTNFQTKTHSLSLALTSQLRLILTPSQSTKLSGSYRTGKRLNIKRIIPYIASSYKRDKIWMRRAIPTKRSYQILLCVDDSRSMGESSSGNLALESLVMVSRALTMLEVGQIGVLGFGANTFMAHEFTEPFASHDAGAKVLQKFSFRQDYTNVSLLIQQTIARFRMARAQNPGRGSEDLWQLALVLSDGLTPSAAHEDIRRLLREAAEERIMVVFIVMDDTANKKKGESVLDLRQAKFIKDELGNSQVITEWYLDTFPFQYYLIVHNLEDLPGALAGLLRTWFAEVNA